MMDLEYGFTVYILDEDDVEFHDQYILLKAEDITKAVNRGAQQIQLWLSELDKTIYVSVAVVSNHANFDLGLYFVPYTFWVSP